jgi:PAS domain S-box-containing protein
MEPGGAINTWNKGCRQVLGYDEMEFLNMNAEQLFVPEDLSAGIPKNEFQTASEKGSTQNDRWMMRKNGERFWASGATTALRDDNGVLIGFTKVMRDSTCERRIEQETEENVERFRFLAETTRSLLETRDPAELLNRIYDGLADIFGLEFYFHYLVEPHRRMRLGAYRGVSVERIKEVERLEFGQTVCGTAARDGKPIIIPDVQQSTEPMTEYIRSLGITAYACHPLIANRELLGTLSFGTTRVRAFAPEIVSVMRALSDIVAVAIARKRAEECLAERARLLDISREAIIVRGPDERVVYWNHGAEALYGWTEDEARGQNPCELLQSVLPEPMEKVMEKFNRDDYWEGEIKQKARDGREVIVLVTGAAARDEKGQLRGILHTHTDITELKRAQRELAKANKELGDYARNLELAVRDRTAHLQETVAELESVSYSLSHDMRAPLRTINSFAQIILAEAGERLGSFEKDLLCKSISAAERLDRLIQDVLVYTRVSRGPAPLASVDVERLLRQIIAERPELQPPQAEIKIESPLGSVYGHEAHLTQCVTNLLGNAVKFVVPGTQPRISIRGEERDGQVRLWFEDNGIGVPRESQERIFGIFERMHDEKVYPGTGIGLAIVRKAVERMGGSVGLESEPGKGSRFWVQLPYAEKSLQA